MFRSGGVTTPCCAGRTRAAGEAPVILELSFVGLVHVDFPRARFGAPADAVSVQGLDERARERRPQRRICRPDQRCADAP